MSESEIKPIKAEIGPGCRYNFVFEFIATHDYIFSGMKTLGGEECDLVVERFSLGFHSLLAYPTREIPYSELGSYRVEAIRWMSRVQLWICIANAGSRTAEVELTPQTLSGESLAAYMDQQFKAFIDAIEPKVSL
jgi:hypothetical protein